MITEILPVGFNTLWSRAFSSISQPDGIIYHAIYVRLNFNTHNIFYKTRQLRKAGKINKTWIYKDTVYINTNKEDLKSIISINNINQLDKY